MEVSKYYDPKTKIISMPDDEEIQLDENGIGSWLFNAMSNNLNSIAQIDGETGEEQTMAEYLQKCIRTALEMRKLGISPGDIVSICSYNHLDTTIPFVATLFLGAITASLDPTLSLDDTLHLIKLVNPKLIFVSDNSEELITRAKELGSADFEIVVFGKSEKNLEFSQFVQEKPNENQFVPHKIKNIQDTGIILFSSGTTGLPKGICLSHEFCMWHIEKSKLTATLLFASLYWVSNTFATLKCIVGSSTKIVCKSLEPEKLWEQIQKYNIEAMFLSPYDALRSFPYVPKNYKSNLKTLIIGGSYLSKESLITYQNALPDTEVINGYAQTELFVFLQPITLKEKLGSIGTPINNRSYKIVDPETEETLGFHERGELRVKTKWCMSGYYKQDSSSNWDKDGFLKTGDICYYDEDFHFYIVDRLKEMFKYKSFHIVPAKLEAILLQHPEIEMAAVMGIPHQTDDNHILAVVQRVPGSQLSVEEVQQFVEDKVDDRHKLRGGVKFMNKIPLTPSSKIKRQILKKIVYTNELI